MLYIMIRWCNIATFSMLSIIVVHLQTSNSEFPIIIKIARHTRSDKHVISGDRERVQLSTFFDLAMTT